MRRGFTLLESIVTTALFGTVLVCALQILLPSLQVWQVNRARADAEQAAILLEFKLNRELSQSSAGSVTITPTALCFLSIDAAQTATGPTPAYFDQGSGKPMWRKYVIYWVDTVSHVMYRLESTTNPVAPFTFPTEVASALTSGQVNAIASGSHPSQYIVARYVDSMTCTMGTGGVAPQSPSPTPSPFALTAALQLESNESDHGPQYVHRSITVQLRNSSP